MSVCLVCANPDLNLIDGSSIWAQTICLALAETNSIDVHFLAKSKPDRMTLYEPLQRHPRITIIDGTDSDLWDGRGFKRINLKQMAKVANKLDEKYSYSLVVVRGWEIAKSFLSLGNLLERSWIYLTDIHHNLDLFTSEEIDELRQIASRSLRILCQSQGLINLWRQIAPDTNESLYRLYTPVVPDFSSNTIPIEQRPRTAIYAGKFKGAWKTLEMAECWPEICKRIPQAKLVMIGDKFHQEPDIEDYPGRMKNALTTIPGINWLGALSRDDVQAQIEKAALGLSWRESDMDDSLEYSTKILEYGRAGCPAILNRNKIHEELLGTDYPLFANDRKEFCGAVIRGLIQIQTAHKAAKRLSKVASQHTFSRRVKTLRSMLSENMNNSTSQIKIKSKTNVDIRSSTGIKTVLVAGHDLKFFRLLQSKLEDTGRYNFIFDQWGGHNKHNETESKELLAKADIIFCEWCLGNLCWYSENKKKNQRLVARLHLQERDLNFIKNMKSENVDHISFVAEHIRNEVLEKISYPRSKTSVVGNLIDEARFKPLKKMGDSVFTLGMIGICPARKRFDLAIDTLEILREKDPRYQLRIKGTSPFDLGWLVDRVPEANYYKNLYQRINSPNLRYSVVFDPPGSNVSEWLSLVGFILSPSDYESFHLAIGEGMLTGSIPVVWDWEGARDIWQKESIVQTPYEAAERIYQMNISGKIAEESKQAREFMLKHHNVQDIVKRWDEIISR